MKVSNNDVIVKKAPMEKESYDSLGGTVLFNNDPSVD